MGGGGVGWEEGGCGVCMRTAMLPLSVSLGCIATDGMKLLVAHRSVVLASYSASVVSCCLTFFPIDPAAGSGVCCANPPKLFITQAFSQVLFAESSPALAPDCTVNQTPSCTVTPALNRPVSPAEPKLHCLTFSLLRAAVPVPSLSGLPRAAAPCSSPPMPATATCVTAAAALLFFTSCFTAVCTTNHSLHKAAAALCRSVLTACTRCCHITLLA